MGRNLYMIWYDIGREENKKVIDKRLTRIDWIMTASQRSTGWYGVRVYQHFDGNTLSAGIRNGNHPRASHPRTIHPRTIRAEKEEKNSYKTKKLKQDAGAMWRHEHFSNCYPLFLRVLLLITNQNSLLTGHHSHCLLFLFRSGTGIFRCGQKKGCACNDFLYLATLSLFPNL